MVHIDKETCDQCGTCISVCPSNALCLSVQLSVDEQRCTSCGRCVKVCAFAALSLDKRVLEKIT